MSFNNEMPPFGRGCGRGQNIFDKKKLSGCTVGIINQQHPMMMNQQNSLTHKSDSYQESNDIKRRRYDDITDPKTSGSQINQESSSLINQMSIDNDASLNNLSQKSSIHANIIKIAKSCPMMSKEKTCIYDKYCPYHHESDDNIKAHDSNSDKKIASIVVTNNNNNSENNLFDLNSAKIYGGISMIKFLDISCFKDYLQNEIINVHNDNNSDIDFISISMKRKKSKIANLIRDFNDGDTNTPIFTYDGPIRIKFLSNDNNNYDDDDDNDNDHNRKIFYKIIIKYRYSYLKYFSFCYWRSKYQAGISLIEITSHNRKSYKFAFIPSSQKKDLGYWGVPISSNIKNHNSVSLPLIDIADEYIFHIIPLDVETSYKKEMEILNNINNVKNIMKYTGCTLCHGNHPVSNCDFSYIFKNNDEIEKFKYYQQNLTINQQKKLENHHENLPILFIFENYENRSDKIVQSISKNYNCEPPILNIKKKQLMELELKEAKLLATIKEQNINESQIINNNNNNNNNNETFNNVDKKSNKK